MVAEREIKRAKVGEKDKTEIELEAFLFGDTSADSLIHNILNIKSSDGSEEETLQSQSLEETSADEAALFYIDSKPDTAEQDLPVTIGERVEKEVLKKTAAAWSDDDDEEITVDISTQNRLRKLRTTEDEDEIDGKEYEQRLRNQFERIFPKPSWAETFEEDQTADDVEICKIFSTTGNLVAKSSQLLKPDEIEIARLYDANKSEYSQSIVTSVQWHPNGQTLLVGGFDKTLRLFHIDGQQNTKLQSVHFKDTPIHCAKWLPNGREIIVAGRRKHFYSFNVDKGVVSKTPFLRGRDEKSLESFNVSPCGKFITFYGDNGDIILVSTQDKECLGSLRMNGNVRAVDFTSDGKYIFGTGGDGEVYQWDLGSRKCVHRFTDEGGVQNTALAVSKSGEYLATGGVSGFVNLYQTRNGILSNQGAQKPTPFKSISNLTTYIDQIGFNYDSQLMAICSRTKKDQFKLVHLPTGRVYANFPKYGMTLGYVQAFDFSPNGSQIAIGNDKGKVLLYRLQHYASQQTFHHQ